jgi:hypothetical protein
MILKDKEITKIYIQSLLENSSAKGLVNYHMDLWTIVG